VYKEAVSPGTGSLHPGLKMGTGEFNAGGNPAMDQQGWGEEIFLVASCCRNRE